MKAPGNILQIPNASPLLAVVQTPKGRGLMAWQGFHRGDVVERSCVLLVHDKRDLTKRSAVHRYTFAWSATHSALALGMGTLFNHSYNPNVRWDPDEKEQQIVFRALRDIAANEELTIDYSGDGKSPVGFQVKP